MNLNNGEFETIGSDGIFSIFIKRETVIIADDAGNAYMREITNEYQLDKITARELLNELKLYLGDV